MKFIDANSRETERADRRHAAKRAPNQPNEVTPSEDPRISEQES
jgi:hypothetical protein